MSTLLLFCAFSLPGNSVHYRVMTPNEVDHLADFRIRADHDIHDLVALHSYQVRLCRDSYGRMPSLVWTKGGRS